MQNDLQKLTDTSGGGWQGAFMPIQNKKWRRIALALLILVPVIVVGWYLVGNKKPVPETTIYRGGQFWFAYPTAGKLQEYATGVVSVGNETNDAYSPLVEVVRYKSDPDVATPASFDAFAKQQALNLCGSDAAEKVTCSNVTAEPYTSPFGYKGLKMSMTLTRTNLSSGTSTAATYAPIYAINTTSKPEAGERLRYEGIFVYHALPAVLSGSVAPALLDQVLGSLKILKLSPQTPTQPAATSTTATSTPR